MSEYRYFQEGDYGYVESTRNADNYVKNYPNETEVQVVPLDAIVIKDPLPLATPVSSGETNLVVTDLDVTWEREHVEKFFLQIVAAKQWFDANPPTDPKETAQIAALSKAYSAFRLSGIDTGAWNDIATKMYKAGFRIETNDQDG